MCGGYHALRWGKHRKRRRRPKRDSEVGIRLIEDKILVLRLLDPWGLWDSRLVTPTVGGGPALGGVDGVDGVFHWG
jgi:hypothetical protein